MIKTMQKKADISKEKLIKKEENKLIKMYRDTEDKKKELVKSLVSRAAFMKITLIQLEDDINEKGTTEMFSQGNQEPYERSRPEFEQYNKLNTNYQKIIKLLSDLLPKEAEKIESDGFEEFIDGRDENI